MPTCCLKITLTCIFSSPQIQYLLQQKLWQTELTFYSFIMAMVLTFIFGIRLKTLYELKFNGHVTDAQGCITG